MVGRPSWPARRAGCGPDAERTPATTPIRERGAPGRRSSRSSCGRLDAEIDFNNYDADPRQPRRDDGLVTPTSEPVAIAPVGAGITADGRELRHFAISRYSGRRPALVAATGRSARASREATSASGTRWAPARDETGLLGLLAWHRRKLGWLDPSQVRCLGSEPLEVTLEPTWRAGRGQGRRRADQQDRPQSSSRIGSAPVSMQVTAGRASSRTRCAPDWQYHLWRARRRPYRAA